MLGFNHLGKIGRLGNQMFQCAALVGISEHRGFEYCIPDHSSFSDYGGYEHHELQSCFKMTEFVGKYGYVDGDLIEVHQYDFCEELMDECPDNATLIGYFETEKYFKHCEDKIRSNYEFKDHILEKCDQYGKNVLNDKPVGIIVRRGDFLAPHNINGHPVCGVEYYENAMNIFKGRQFLIFSDDLEWCKKQEVFLKQNIFFVDSSEGIYKGHFDLCLLSMCSDFIIANSTFAWWGAWLSSNKEKKVVAPKKWFGPDLIHNNTKDLYLKEWIIL